MPSNIFIRVETHLQRAHALELEEAAHPPRAAHAPRPSSSTQVECAALYTLYHASAAQDMHSRACGVCIPEAARWCQNPQGRA